MPIPRSKNGTLYRTETLKKFFVKTEGENEMNNLSRRDFLKCFGMGTVSAAALFALAGCSDKNKDEDVSSNSEIDRETEIDETEVDTSREITGSDSERFDEIVFAITSDPQNLNPWDPNSSGKGNIYPYFYENLFDYDELGYYPVIGKSYELTNDGFSWDIELYDYVKDSEGNPITADDVLYSYQVQFESGYVVKHDMFESIEKLDTYKVRINWNKVIDGVCEVEWPLCNIIIFSQAAYESHNFATDPVGTGPYTVESFTAGSGAVLEARDDYWQTDADLIQIGHHSNVQRIELQIVSETAQHVMALQNGTIDFSTAIPAENLSDFTEGGAYADKYSVYRKPSGTQYYIFGNMSGNSIWSDKNFRLAVFYGLDSDALATAGNLATCQTYGSPYFSNFYNAWLDDENYVNVYDESLAKDYLEKSGYEGQTLTLLCTSTEYIKATATIIVAMMKKIGINVEISATDEVTLSNLMTDPTAYDMAMRYAGGPNLIGTWNLTCNNADYADGNSLGMLNDPTLIEKYKYCNVAENYNVENMTDLKDYIIDNAYFYSYGYVFSNYVYTNEIAQLGLNRASALRLGDCTYYLS